jgi:hypothetical protein
MGDNDYLALGDWNAYCSMCGRKRKASKMVRNWQGMYRCPEHNEERQPQDFARGVADQIGVPWAQDQGPDFIMICSYNDRSGIPGYCGPGCAIPGNTNYLQNMISDWSPANPLIVPNVNNAVPGYDYPGLAIPSIPYKLGV